MMILDKIIIPTVNSLYLYQLQMSTTTSVTVMGIIIASVTFTGSLLWNGFFQAWIARKYPSESSALSDSGTTTTTVTPSKTQVWAKFWFALGFTLITVVIVYFLAVFLKSLSAKHSKWLPSILV